MKSRRSHGNILSWITVDREEGFLHLGTIDIGGQIINCYGSYSGTLVLIALPNPGCYNQDVSGHCQKYPQRQTRSQVRTTGTETP